MSSYIRLIGKNESDALAYDEFGVPLVGANNIHQPFGFTAYQTDDVSGLYYAQNRYYAPKLGVFAAEDPIKDQLNWYSYCAGNPIKFFDPDGLKVSAKHLCPDAQQTVLDFLNMLTDHELDWDKALELYIKTYSDLDTLRAGNALIEALINSDFTVYIKLWDTDNHIVGPTIDGGYNRVRSLKDMLDALNGTGMDAIVEFNPNAINKLTLANNRGRARYDSKGTGTPPEIALAHELIHALRIMRGAFNSNSDDTARHTYTNHAGIETTAFPMREEAATIGLGDYAHPRSRITENRIRKEQGLPLRVKYGTPDLAK